MRRVIFSCAMSLDGYIAGPNGEYDWIVMDPDVDFAAMMARFDTFLIGRKTYEAMRSMMGDTPAPAGVRNIVFSHTLKAEEHPNIILQDDAERTVAELRAQPGKDIMLFGGGELFRALLAAGLVDTIEVGIIPVLLGAGVPLLPPTWTRTTLKLRSHRLFETTGSVSLIYDVVPRA
ncbi:MAG: dihydrofolate reductase [Acidobacteria bacterium]|nr:dihydrofolate reductase [Acidobacteriota bacterium]